VRRLAAAAGVTVPLPQIAPVKGDTGDWFLIVIVGLVVIAGGGATIVTRRRRA
jgi:LPXTG-motif cell wall-anchored protein